MVTVEPQVEPKVEPKPGKAVPADPDYKPYPVRRLCPTQTDEALEEV